MFQQYFQFFVKYFEADPRLCGAVRSSQWPTVRKNHLALQPSCANCGGSEQLEVHHKIPFQIYPKNELNPRNLITLCEKHNCHFAAGHLFDWKSWNPNVEEDAANVLKKVLRRP